MDVCFAIQNSCRWVYLSSCQPGGFDECMNVSNWQELLGVCEMLTAGFRDASLWTRLPQPTETLREIETLAGRYPWAGT